MELSHTEPFREYSSRAYRALKSETKAILDEADLFAACLLACSFHNFDDLRQFTIHLGGFTTILEILTAKTRARDHRPELSPLWPLCRDLIFHSSRCVSGASGPILQFCLKVASCLGNQSFYARSEYAALCWYSGEQSRKTAFDHSVTHYYVLLRRCLRYVVSKQLY